LQRAFAVFLLVVAVRMLWTGTVKRPPPGLRAQAGIADVGK